LCLAKLGEQCNEYLGLFCADQSSLCFNGYCQCIPPMIEQQGQCQMPPTREAAPGELCNSGQVCVGGSVCNQQVPLCVCPKETELVKGRCVERNLERASKEEKIEDKVDFLFEKFFKDFFSFPRPPLNRLIHIKIN